MAKDQQTFDEFKRHQFRPDEFVFARDEIEIMRVNNVMVVALPGWLENHEYSRIRNLRGLLDRVRARK